MAKRKEIMTDKEFLKFKESKNSGFTLIELLIAVAILAVVVAPLLMAFVISTRTNTKARQLLQATDIAENLMETLVDTSLSNLTIECDFGYGSSIRDALNITEGDLSELKEDKSLVHSAMEITETDAGGNLKVTGYTFLGNDDDKYYFALKNIKATGNDYTALLSVSRNDGKIVTDAHGKTIDLYNGAISDINAIKDSTDGVSAFDDYSLDIVQEMVNANEELSSKISLILSGKIDAGDNNATFDSVMREEILRDDMERSIIIDIVPASQAYPGIVSYSGNTLVTVSYSYKLKYDGETYLLPGDNDSLKSRYTTEIYNGDSLSNIYLMYYPWYASNYIDCKDYIYVNNTSLAYADLHIIKQRYPVNAYDDASIRNLEGRYSAEVVVREGSTRINGASKKITRLSILTNLGTNLISGNEAPLQAEYQYNNNASQQAVKTAMGIRGLTDTLEGSQKPRLYNVTVYILPKNGLAELDLSSISSDDYIYAITGGLKD